jgi:hypothetical protein
VAVECPKCKAKNPNRGRFCGDCGAPLKAVPSDVKDSADFVRRDQVVDIVRQHYKDQKVVEIETTQAIASRFSEWTKLLAFFVGLPVAALFLLLGFFGIKTYTDFSTQVKSAEKEITQRLNRAKEGADELKTKGDALAKDYARLQAQLADTNALAKQVNVLSAKVDAIGEKIGFTPTSRISTDAKARLMAKFEDFKKYLQERGYKGTTATIEIDITDKPEYGMLAYYDPGKQRAVINSKYAGEAVILLREYMHHVLGTTKGPGGPEADQALYIALESALAWYLPCSFLDDPLPAPNATEWDLKKKRSFSELRLERNEALLDGTEIWASALWAMREKLGREVLDKLLLDAWAKLRPEDFRANRGENFARKLLELAPTQQDQVREVFATRGLAL